MAENPPPPPNNPNNSNNVNANKNRKTGNRNFFRMRNRVQSNGPRPNTVSLLIPLASSSATNSAANRPGGAFEPSAAQVPSISFQIDKRKGPYSGWKLYFPEIEYKDDLPLIRKVKAFEQHIKSHPLSYKLNEIRQQMWFPLSLQRLEHDDDFNRQFPTFISDLNSSVMETLMCAGLAAHQRIQMDLPATMPSLQSPASQLMNGKENQTKLSLLPIRARIQGHTPIVNLSTLKQDIYNCLISVRGTVVRVNPPILKCSWIAFRCSKCKSEQAIRQTNMAKCNTPNSCKASGCNARSNFVMLQNSLYTRTESYQTIRLQESVQSVKGQIPKTIDVDLAYDLVDMVCPGDDITVTGIMRVRTKEKTNTFNRSAKQGTEAGIHKYFIYAVTIVSNKNTIAVRNLDFNEREIDVIKSIAKQPNIFKVLVHSLCPRIFGHEMVKAGLILSLFGASGNGGAEKRPGMGKRSEIHVLVVGDPGLGKSLLIQSCSNVSPRGIFVCGNSATNAGLTVSIRHDKGSDGTLEAGALVLADQGVCCIDEFDKMSSNYQSLLQVMEQQSVSVAKAGVLCALPARTSILAAANPSAGHYDKSKTVAENLKIWPTLLSRFDLVFILLDQADAYLDSLLTNHIQALKTNQNKSAAVTTAAVDRFRSNLTQAPSFSLPSPQLQQLTPEQSDAPLHERLKLTTTSTNQFQPLPTEIIRKYILYARKFCFPTISAEATEELQKFYTEMRAKRCGIDTVPVTTRQLEALIRMTQARARLELATEATVQHARDVLDILRYTMIDVLSTDRGTLKMKRSINGSGMSHSTKVKRFLQLLQEQSKNIFSVSELNELAASLGFEAFANQIIDTLNVQGFLIKRGTNIYKFNT